MSNRKTDRLFGKNKFNFRFDDKPVILRTPGEVHSAQSSIRDLDGISVVERNEGIFSTELQQRRLQRVGSSALDRTPSWYRSDERDLLDERVHRERLAALASAWENVEHSGREYRAYEFGESQGRERSLLGRL
jgi:hypothetical protein